MRIIMKGNENGKDTTYRYDLLDRYQDELFPWRAPQALLVLLLPI